MSCKCEKTNCTSCKCVKSGVSCSGNCACDKRSCKNKNNSREFIAVPKMTSGVTFVTDGTHYEYGNYHPNEMKTAHKKLEQVAMGRGMKKAIIGGYITKEGQVVCKSESINVPLHGQCDMTNTPIGQMVVEHVLHDYAGASRF